jgi:hypothetical protein
LFTPAGSPAHALGDLLRRVSLVSYRTRQLADATSSSIGSTERAVWERIRWSTALAEYAIEQRGRARPTVRAIAIRGSLGGDCGESPQLGPTPGTERGGLT